MQTLILRPENRRRRFAARVEHQHAVEIGFAKCFGEGIERGDLVRVGDGDHLRPEPDERAISLVEADVCCVSGVREDPAGSGKVGEVAEKRARDVGEGEIGGCVPG